MSSKIISGILLVIMISMVPAFAQTADTTQPDLTGCTIFLANEVYTPFTVTLEHDPAVKKTITTSHNDPASALQLQGADPTKQEQKNINPKTHMTFSSNDTDDWQVVAQLEHPITNTTMHTLTANLFVGPQQKLVSSQKVFYTGNNFCMLFKLVSTPPIHIMTEAEVVATAEKVQEAKYQEFNANIEKYTSQATAAGNSAGFLGIVMVILTLVNFVSNRIEKSKLSAAEEKAELAEQSFKSAVDVQNKITQGQEMHFNDQVRNQKENFAQVAKSVLESAQQSQMLTYKAISDFYLILQERAKRWGIQSLPIKAPEPPKELDIDALVESIVNPPTGVIIESAPTSSNIPVLGKVLNKIQKPKLPDRIQYWYDEFMKGIDEKYKGELPRIFDENIKEANQDPKSEARAKCEAILQIIKDNGNAWP